MKTWFFREKKVVDFNSNSLKKTIENTATKTFPSNARIIRDRDRCWVWINGFHAKLLLREDGSNKASLGTLQAPMTASVISINVKEGDIVKSGENLITLFAMKMEYALIAPQEGTIAKILCTKGDLVEHGQILVEMK